MEPINVPDIRARELLTVLALAEYGSFVAASAFLKTSQPAITRTLKRVERILGVTLFARSTRRVEITAAGREFVGVAERVLHDLGIAVRNMRDVGSEQRGQVIIATYSSFACEVLPDILNTYRETRPNIDIRLREGRQPDITEYVRSGVADFGIGFVDTLPDTLERTTLRKEPLYVLLPSGHKLAARSPRRLSLAALQNEPIVALPSDSITRRLIDGAAAAEGYTLRPGLEVTRFESVVRYVRAGAGVGIIPAGAVPRPPWDGFHAAPLTSPSLSVTLGVITLRGRYMSPTAMSLIALITERVNPRLRPAAVTA